VRTDRPSRAAAGTNPSALERATIGTVRRRLIPFLFLLYLTAYLDRVNVGFAALQMNHDLGFSGVVYGFGAGVFFLSYALFEVPSNLILARVGARRWIARIMITWGMIASGMMFVRTPLSFYLLRFLLGVAEAGFLPGILFYLSSWFPAAERGRAIAGFMVANPISGVVSGVLAGPLLGLGGRLGLAGWQWLFLLEGLPALALGIIVLWYLPDQPEAAPWLKLEERTWLAARLQSERTQCVERHGLTLRQALASGTVWQLGLLYFLTASNGYAYSLWSPQLIRGLTGLSNTSVGFVAAAISLTAAVCMLLNGAHSDRHGERCLHVAVPASVAALGAFASVWLRSPVLGVLALALIPIGVYSLLGPFWSLPSVFLTGEAAAGGIALINSLASFSGFVGSNLLGFVKDATGDYRAAMLILMAMALGAAALALHLRRGQDLSPARPLIVAPSPR
jgi:ACS family tartrate transporter-like MFS transporter